MLLFLLLIVTIFPTVISFFLLKKYIHSFDYLEYLAASFLIGQLGLVEIVFVLSLIFGFTLPLLAVVLLAVTGFGLYKLYYNRSRGRSYLSESLNSLATRDKYIAITYLIFAFIFMALLSKHMLLEKDLGLYTSHTTYGDLPYHVAMVTSMSEGNFPPENPIYSGQRLSYPFLTNFYSSIFYKLGIPIQAALIWPLFFFFSALTLMAMVFMRRFLGSSAGAALGMSMYYLNGGIGGFAVMRDAMKMEEWIPALGGALGADVGVGRLNIIFTNNLSSVLISQRSLAAGLAVLSLVALVLWIAFEKKHVRNEFILTGLVIGLLPLWHTHTLIALGITLPFYALILAFLRRSLLGTVKELLPILYFSVPLGVLGILWHVGQVFSGGHFFSVNIGWIVGQEGQLAFWYRNLFLFLPLLPVGIYFLNRKQLLYFIPFCILLLAANIYQFQPLVYDNYKIVMMWHLIACAVVAKALISFGVQHKIGVSLNALLFSLIIFSGVVLVLADYVTSYQLFGPEEIQLSRWVQQAIPAKSVVLSGAQHNSVMNLAGRKIFLGYGGFIWTQGIDQTVREAEVQRMYHGDTELIHKNHIDYILVGNFEEEHLTPDKTFLENTYPLVGSTDNYKIYKVKK